MHAKMSFLQCRNKCSLIKIVLCITVIWMPVAGQKTERKEPPEGSVPEGLMVDFNKVPRDFINVSIFPLDTDCRIDLTKTQVRFRNLCPFVNVQNYDENRRPSTILETQCCTSKSHPGFNPADSVLHCLTDRDVLGKRLVKKICEPVVTHRMVVRRTGCSETDGVYEYSKVLEPVQVGCSCTYSHLEATESVVKGIFRPSPET